MSLQLRLVNLLITPGAVIKYMSLNKQEFHMTALKPGPFPALAQEHSSALQPRRPNLTRFTFRRVKPELSNGGNTLEPLFRAFLPVSAEQKKNPSLFREWRRRYTRTNRAGSRPSRYSNISNVWIKKQIQCPEHIVRASRFCK